MLAPRKHAPNESCFPSDPYERYAADAMNVIALSASPAEGLTAWGILRLASADGPAVHRYLIGILPILRLTVVGWSPVTEAVAKKFMRRLMEFRGIHRAGPRPVIGINEYRQLLALLPQPIRAVVALCWRRMARVADILEVRLGGLWSVADGSIWIEVPWAKQEVAGSFERLALSFDAFDLPAVKPHMSSAPPTLPPHRRPVMFPEVTTTKVADAIEAVLGRRTGAHTLRRSAMRAAISAGVPLPVLVLLSLHASPDTVLGYVGSADEASAGLMRDASTATTGAPRWFSADDRRV